MRINYAARIRALSAPELEEFVDDWVAQRFTNYHGHQLWRGTGDMGRDVTGYVTDRRMEGPWDNFQCKQCRRRLNIEPPCRLNFEPGRVADLGMGNCG